MSGHVFVQWIMDTSLPSIAGAIAFIVGAHLILFRR